MQYLEQRWTKVEFHPPPPPPTSCAELIHTMPQLLIVKVIGCVFHMCGSHKTIVVSACEERIGEHEQFMVVISMDICNPQRLYKKVHYTNSVLTLYGISEHNFYMFNFNIVHDIMCPKMRLANDLDDFLSVSSPFLFTPQA